MGKMVGFVFKTLVLTILLVTIVTLATSLVDVFVSYSRVDSITEYIEFDIAQNNCLLNDTYMSYAGDANSLLSSVAKRSRCWKWQDDNGNWGDDASESVKLFVGADSNDYFIQKDIDQQKNGVVYSDSLGEPGNNLFYVAQYGQILHLQLHAGARLFVFGSVADATDSGLDQMSLLMTPKVDVVLKYDIPALTYLK